ncbi:MAG: hypothetical protein Q8M15_05225 [Bacteroidota bacterium]|nr:hypothetical protein [Bacteroidota bacterium]
MKSKLSIVFFILATGICSQIFAQEQFAYVYDSTSKHDYCIRYYKTNVTVLAYTPEKEKFNDKIIAIDSNGIYFEIKGFYSYKNIDSVSFIPYHLARSIFQRIYYLSVLNGVLYLTYYTAFKHYKETRYMIGLTGFVILTSPIWAFVIPRVIIGFRVPHKQVIKTKSAVFKSSGNVSPFR